MAKPGAGSERAIREARDLEERVASGLRAHAVKYVEALLPPAEAPGSAALAAGASANGGGDACAPSAVRSFCEEAVKQPAQQQQMALLSDPSAVRCESYCAPVHADCVILHTTSGTLLPHISYLHDPLRPFTLPFDPGESGPLLPLHVRRARPSHAYAMCRYAHAVLEREAAVLGLQQAMWAEEARESANQVTCHPPRNNGSCKPCHRTCTPQSWECC